MFGLRVFSRKNNLWVLSHCRLCRWSQSSCLLPLKIFLVVNQKMLTVIKCFNKCFVKFILRSLFEALRTGSCDSCEVLGEFWTISLKSQEYFYFSGGCRNRIILFGVRFNTLYNENVFQKYVTLKKFRLSNGISELLSRSC